MRRATAAVWRSTIFDRKHRFNSGLSRGRYTWIAISNFLATVVTLGLLRPWAAVRMARYKWERTGVTIVGTVGTLMSDIEAQSSAVGAVRSVSGRIVTVPASAPYSPASGAAGAD